MKRAISPGHANRNAANANLDACFAVVGFQNTRGKQCNIQASGEFKWFLSWVLQVR